MSTNEEPQVSFIYGNMLRVNKKTPWAAVLLPPDLKKFEIITPDQFATVLEVGREAIKAIHRTMPEVFALRLSGLTDPYSRETSLVYTPQGYDKLDVRDEKTDILEDFHPYWEVVEDADLVPVVRGVSGKTDGGPWIMVQSSKK